MSRVVVIRRKAVYRHLSRAAAGFRGISKSLPSVADKGRRISRLTPGKSCARSLCPARPAKIPNPARSRNAGTEHLRRRTVRNDAAACQDEPIAASFLNSQDAPRPGDRISGRYLLRTIATVNHRDAIPYILDAIVSEQGPRVLGSGCFIRGGRFRPCQRRRLFRRGRREGIGRSCAREGGSLLQLVEPCRETGNF